jgi:hypothetical protein
MPNRALIVAISKYPMAQGLVSYNLDLIQQAAISFYNWLRSAKGLQPQDIFICHDGVSLPDDQPTQVSDSNGDNIQLVYGTQAQDVRNAVTALLTLGADQTDELWVYCAGHGYSYGANPNDPGVGFLITSEFRNSQTSGAASINISYLQAFLRTRLSGNRHFYFVDACRTTFDADSIDPPGSIGVAWKASSNTQTRAFSLYSAPPGYPAPADNAFNQALVDGLKGKGRAKMWLSDQTLWVTFSRLSDYVQQALGRPVDGTSQIGDQLLQINPTGQPCSVQICNAVNPGGYTLRIGLGQFTQTQTFDAPTFKALLDPSDHPYTFTLMQGQSAFNQKSPAATVAIDMYDPYDLVFELHAPLQAAAQLAPVLAVVQAAPSAVSERASDGDTVKETAAPLPEPLLRQDALPQVSFTVADNPEILATLSVNPDFLIGDGDPHPSRTVLVDNALKLVDNEKPQSVKVMPGSHSVLLIEDGRQVWQARITVSPGETRVVNVGSTAKLRFQRELLAALNQTNFRTPDLADSLGPSADWDPNLWLAWLAVVWLRPVAEHAPELAAFANGFGDPPAVTKGGSALAVLIVDEDGAPSFALGSPEKPEWQRLAAHPSLGGMYYVVTEATPGADYLSIRMSKGSSFTYATAFSPDAVTAATISQGATMRIQQFELPIGPVDLGWPAPGLDDLQTIRLLSSAQTMFSHKRPVWNSGLMAAASWKMFELGQWKNAQLAALCALEARATNYPDVLAKLLKTYAAGSVLGLGSDIDLLRESPPISALARPLLLAAFLLNSDSEKAIGLPSGLIDYHGLWLSWYGIAASSHR